MSKPLVFISHVRQDEQYARKLVHTLRDEGTNVWSAQDALHTGSDWSAEITRVIDRANVFVVLVSPNFLASKWGMFELGAAMGRKWQSPDSRVIPVIIQGARFDDLPVPVQQFQALDGRRLSPERVGKRLARLIHDRPI